VCSNWCIYHMILWTVKRSVVKRFSLTKTKPNFTFWEHVALPLRMLKTTYFWKKNFSRHSIAIHVFYRGVEKITVAFWCKNVLKVPCIKLHKSVNYWLSFSRNNKVVFETQTSISIKCRRNSQYNSPPKRRMTQYCTDRTYVNVCNPITGARRLSGSELQTEGLAAAWSKCPSAKRSAVHVEKMTVGGK